MTDLKKKKITNQATFNKGAKIKEQTVDMFRNVNVK